VINCLDCGKLVGQGILRCRKCYNNSRKVLPHFCKDCGIILAKYAKSIRCHSCNNKITRKNNKNISNPEALEKRRLKMTGKKIHSEEFKRKQSQRMKLNNPSFNIETRKKQSKTHLLLELSKGKNNPNYKGGIHKIKRPRDIKEYKEWRLHVFERDYYTCSHCKQWGGKLEAHHIMSWKNHKELRYALSNGITLCSHCHKLLHREIGRK